MAADLPENYEKYRDLFQFIIDVPADWEETRMLNGQIGEYVTLARKQRNHEDWYLGSMTNEKARDLTVPLTFNFRVSGSPISKNHRRTGANSSLSLMFPAYIKNYFLGSEG